MLSRTADNLYWLARYVERAEYLARMLEAPQRLTTLPLAYGGPTNEWESAVADRRLQHAFSQLAEANEETVIEFLAFSPDNPSSIRNCFELARTNARAVRTALTGRDVGRDQRRLARAEALRQRADDRARSYAASCAG